ncbi:aminodeoxychorismate synthase, component I [Natronobacterium gregoryi]|uniref:anthranilate synthase n=2 Tax=Natronobacterium gregoryi TaxID=44930 RepID=L0AE50_NATGS|nr:aminodeoxychorismate synthase, component I [Natronobacterium gregoryi]AFZ72178.1 aminodeoxychorismate synthase, component I, clade 2 [Natronobacterium gregoryi SP2]ELY63048.1 para-aminobenzoate synthase component I [Natronobacterium gregoryi SP2]PLK20122.1 anthranilate synthase component I [Natronobacterium gregoryi SP2]SFJ32698.1 aminodeoxychorismate synthase, subunit I [Natronobacterium gregoryi]
MTEPRVLTTPDAFRTAAAEDANSSSDRVTPRRVPVEVRISVDDPFVAYRRARDGNDSGGVFLETTGGQPGWGYFGVDPVDRLTVGPEAVTRTDDARSSTLAALEGLLADDRLVRGECTVPYPCGAVGWLSYDVARELEELPDSAADDRGLPRLEVEVYDRLAAWEGPVEGDELTLRVTACPRVDDDVESAYERGRRRALDLARNALEGDPAVGEPPVTTAEATFESDCGREAFSDRVERAKEYVRDGDTFQANVSQRLTAPAAVHPVAAYDALRRVNPAPYSCLLEFRAADLVSASPELLLERDGDFVRTEPIAGTRPRGETPEEDAELEDDLLSDEKERAEHAMLVDLERNDLGKVCAYGTVEVEEYRRIDRYSEVMHLVSNVTGQLRTGETLADAVAAAFPGGTITGAPKPRTMEIIDELEATRRGPYTGSVGLFGFDGRATLNITIRTLVCQAEKYHLRVGAGIVHDSEPSREYDETLDKARALITAVDDALGERAEMALETDGGPSGAVLEDEGDGGEADE